MTSPSPKIQQKELRFGPFTLHPGRRLLREDGEPLRVGNRAMDILLALVERAGAIVTREELTAAAWPDTVVEDINLRVHIAALRRVLGGHRYIVNVVGRGYSFVGALTEDEAEPPPAQLADTSSLPAVLTRVIGRAVAAGSLARLVPERRLVTLVGTGGVGKSTLALAVAAQLSPSYSDGAHFVDLSAIVDPASVPISLATVLGITIPIRNPLPGLLTLLQGRHMLLVIDNCEHVIDSVAMLCEQLLKSAPGIHILATSREPLGAEGEWLHRLPPLEVPHASAQVDAASASTFSAVQLFLERARTLAQNFVLTDANATAVGDICRRLDGIPLAIELAVSRLGMFGIEELAGHLDDHFLLVAQGRRTAAPRHQTLRATLDWSYQLLGTAERRMLRQLAVFNGSFAVESALAVASRSAIGVIDEQQLFDCVLNLADKSLLVLENNGDIVRHRLLHTTRAFALEKLAASGERELALRWHAEHHRELLHKAEADWDLMSKPQWVAHYAHAIEDIRAALDWAFSTAGEVVLGAELTIAAMPFGYQLGLMDEFVERVELALQRLMDLPARHPVLISQLNSMLYILAWNNEGERSARGNAALAASVQLSQRIEVVKYKVEPLVITTIDKVEIGRYDEAVELAGQLQAVVANTDDPLARLLAERAIAQVHVFAGEYAAARKYARRVLDHPVRAIPLGYQRLTVDRRVSMRIVLARALWFEGYFDEAARISTECIEHSLGDTPLAICQALALAACPIALWNGQHELVAAHIEQLHDVTMRFRISHWRNFADCYSLALQRRIEPAGMESVSYPPGLRRDSLLTIEPAIVANLDLDDIPVRGWCTPEILRVQAIELATRDSGARAAEAGPRLQQALELARTQNALAWQLRIATSLAQLAMHPPTLAARAIYARQRDTALALLADIHGRFTEGHATRDMQRAREVLGAIG